MKKPILLSVIAVALMSMNGAWAAEPNLKRGEELLHNKCFGCHGTDVYVRKDRIVNSYPALLKRVRFCETQLGLTWFDDEIADVASYLNTEYYKFDKANSGDK